VSRSHTIEYIKMHQANIMLSLFSVICIFTAVFGFVGRNPCHCENGPSRRSSLRFRPRLVSGLGKRLPAVRASRLMRYPERMQQLCQVLDRAARMEKAGSGSRIWKIGKGAGVLKYDVFAE
jgi:hypothetical protein